VVKATVGPAAEHTGVLSTSYMEWSKCEQQPPRPTPLGGAQGWNPRGPGRPTFLRGVHERREAFRPIPTAVVAADLDLKGRVGPDAVVAVDEVLRVGAGHARGLPTGAALPAEGQQVAEAISILVLP
jgi:hypothetical protein